MLSLYNVLLTSGYFRAQDRLAYLLALGEDPRQKVCKRKAHRAIVSSNHSSDSEADLRAFLSDESDGEDEVSNRLFS